MGPPAFFSHPRDLNHEGPAADSLFKVMPHGVAESDKLEMRSRANSTYPSIENKRNEVRRGSASKLVANRRCNLAQIFFSCRSLHRIFTIHAQVFDRAVLRLTGRVRPFTLNSSMHTRQHANTAWIVLLAAVMFANVLPVSAESVTLFRVFLKDGTSVVSYGEYARVGERLVFSMPFAPVTQAASVPRLHLINLPMSAVDWAATTKYADTARYAHYLKTRAEADYATLAGEIAATLNAIVLVKDPRTRLDMAVSARRRLATWPRDHYGYRADDVREMLTLLDEAISGLRAAAGETTFVLDFVATNPLPREPRTPAAPLAPPTVQEAIQQALSVAKSSDIAADRISILGSVLAALDDAGTEIPVPLAAATRKWVVETLSAEAHIGQQYSALATGLLGRAARAAQGADVRSIEQLIETAERRDSELRKRRPEEVNALLAHLREQLDAAQRLRLERDKWQERRGAYRAYTKVISPILAALVRSQKNLDDIKSLAGSDAEVLVELSERLSTNMKTLAVVSVPDELKPAHTLLTSAVALADTAVRTRRQATLSGDLALAWEASSAAAGSMMLLTRAKESMETAVRLPQAR